MSGLAPDATKAAAYIISLSLFDKGQKNQLLTFISTVNYLIRNIQRQASDNVTIRTEDS
jgi:hypothetical protein